MKIKILSVLFVLLLFISCSIKHFKTSDDTKMDKLLAQYKIVDIDPDISLLSKSDKLVLKKLIEAADIANLIYLRQIHADNEEWLNKLEAGTLGNKKMLEYFLINQSPFDYLNDFKSFIPGIPDNDLGGNFYPKGFTKEEFEKWISEHPEDKKAFESDFTVIRRQTDKLIAVPYSIEYKEDLERIAVLFNEAAGLTQDETLKTYLKARAIDFLDNDYFDSDVSWLNLKNNKVEVTFGPYEPYSDRLLEYKASFMTFLAIKDTEASQKLDFLNTHFVAIEESLPISKKIKYLKRKQDAPIIVVNLFYSTADASIGAKMMAFVLPNNELVRTKYGAKKTMIRNVIQAKADSILIPIAKNVLDKEQAVNVSDDVFFYFNLFHEVGHTMGPGVIVKEDGTEQDIGKALKDMNNNLEECKADVIGYYIIEYLTKLGILDESLIASLWPTALAGFFRSVRWGINDPYAKASLIKYNFLKKHSALSYNMETKKYAVDSRLANQANLDLLENLIKVQASLDYDKAKAFVDKYAVMDADMKNALDSLKEIPVDIHYDFVGARKLMQFN
ncbi:MAG: hypothetical protein ABIA04_04915 [Pseudomonadota bacterium]